MNESLWVRVASPRSRPRCVALDRLRWLIAACFSVSACGPAAQTPSRVPPVENPAAPTPTAARGIELAPLSATELARSQDLSAELEPLLAIGERPFDAWNLATTTDHVAERLTSYGYEVKRRGFSYGEVVAQNLEAEAPGLRRGNQLVIVGARIDTNPGSPGADDNASGVASALVLAKQFASRRALRSLRFVFYSSAGPRAQREAQGAYHYVEQVEQDGREVVAVIELQGLGRYSVAPGSQRYPDGVPAKTPFGEFITLVTQPEATHVADVASDAFNGAASLPVERWLLLQDDPFLQGTCALEFVEKGFPTLLVTDTQAWRSSDVGTGADVGEHLDVQRMARVVAALEPAVQALTGPEGQLPAASSDGLLPSASAPPTSEVLP